MHSSRARTATTEKKTPQQSDNPPFPTHLLTTKLITKKRDALGHLFFCQSVFNPQLSRADSAHRASVGTGTAIHAGIGINFIDVALGDCSSGAFACACSTCYTVVRNFVSHFIFSFLFIKCVCKSTTFLNISNHNSKKNFSHKR